MIPGLSAEHALSFVHDDNLEPVTGLVLLFVHDDGTIVNAEYFLVESAKHNPTMTYRFSVGMRFWHQDRLLDVVDVHGSPLTLEVHGKRLVFLGDRFYVDDVRYQEHKPFPFPSLLNGAPLEITKEYDGAYVWNKDVTFGVLLYAEYDFGTMLRFHLDEGRLYFYALGSRAHVHIE